MLIITNTHAVAPFTLTMLLTLMTSGSVFITAYGQAANSTATSDAVNSTSTTDNPSINPPLIGHSSFYLVQSDTMLPALRRGDILGVENRTSFNDLKIGDIIVFKSPGLREDTGEHEIIVHRVAKIYTTPQGERIIRAKGDANPNSIYLIDYPVTSDRYIGKVLFITTKEDIALFAKAIG